MKHISGVSLIALGVALSANAGWAADGSTVATTDTATHLEEVVVTATRRAENLQNVPVSVSAITASALAKQGVFETSDLNHAMPNLQVSSPYGEAQPNFSVRGVGVGTEFNANAASPVGVYVDEVYQAFRASHGQQLYDLEQIEVVRGPQGTLYGRNTTGGAINFITRQPKLAGTNGNLTAGYGNYNRVNVEGAFEATPITDKLGFRISGTYVKSDPYTHNLLAAGLNASAGGGASGKNFDSGLQPGGSRNYGVRGIVRFRPSSMVDLSLKGYIARSDGGTETPLPTGSSQTSDKIDFLNPNFLFSGLFSALVPAGLLPASYSRSANGLSVNQIQADTVGKALTRSDGVVFTAKINLSSDLKLISVTGYDAGRYEQSTTDCDGTPLRLCAIAYNSRFHAFNQDLRFDFSHGPVKLIAGGFYGKDSVTTDNHPDFFNFLSDVRAAVGLPASYFNPGGAFNGKGLSATSLPTGVNANQHFRQERTSYAIYGEGSYQIIPTVRVTGGLRYTLDRNHFRDGIATYFDDTGAARLITVSNYT